MTCHDALNAYVRENSHSLRHVCASAEQMVSEALAAKFCMRTVRNQPRRGLTASQRDTRGNVSPRENQMPLQKKRELPLRVTDRCEQTLHLEKTNMTIDSLFKKKEERVHMCFCTRGEAATHTMHLAPHN